MDETDIETIDAGGPQEAAPLSYHGVTFRDLGDGQYDAHGRWGTAKVSFALTNRESLPSVTLNGLRLPPLTPEQLALVGVETEDPDHAALEYVAGVLDRCPVGFFRYLPTAHESGGVVYNLVGGVIDRAGCIVVYYGNWHGQSVDRQIDIVFSSPMPHIQSFLETKAEEDKIAMRAAVEQQIHHLQAVLQAMGEAP